MGSNLLQGTAVLELAIAGCGESITVGYCGTLLHLLGASVERASLVIDCADKADKEPGLRAIELEAFLALGKGLVASEPKDLATIAKTATRPDIVLLSGDGSIPAAALRTMVEEVTHALSPKVVVCATAFGLEGPKANWRGSNLVALAAGGSAYYTPGWCTHPEQERPLQIGESAADFLAGAVCATAAVNALRHATENAPITIDASQQDAVLSMMLLNFAWVTHEGLTPSRVANVGRGAPLVPFRCKDGMFSLLTVQESQWKSWVSVMGSPAWASEPIFQTREERSQHWDVLKSLIEEWAAGYTKEELWKTGQQAGVPVFPVYTVPEVIQARQMCDRGFFQSAVLAGMSKSVDVPLGVFDRVSEVVAVGKQSAERRPVPRVIDLSWILAGPHCTSWLGMMGADVIRFESLQRLDQFRVNPPFWGGEKNTNRAGSFHHINQNKRSVALDLNHPAARDVILKLVAGADVVIENFGPGQMSKFGINEDILRAVNPGLIFISSSGLGRTGPDANVRAYGNTIHAYAGMTSRVGYAPDDVRGLSGTWADPLTGVFLALISESAFLRRETAGSGASVDLSMAEVTVFGTVLDAFVRFACGDLPSELPENTAKAYFLSDTFRCLGDDKWIAISMRSGAEAARAAAIVGAKVDEGMQPQDVRLAIAAAVRTRQARELTEALQEAGIAAHSVVDAAEALADPNPRRRGIIVEIEDSKGARFPVVGLPWRSYQNGQVQPQRVRALPDLGADTEAVLLEAGFSVAETQQLSASGALR